MLTKNEILKLPSFDVKNIVLNEWHVYTFNWLIQQDYSINYHYFIDMHNEDVFSLKHEYPKLLTRRFHYKSGRRQLQYTDNNGKRKNEEFHRVVGRTYLGPPPECPPMISEKEWNNLSKSIRRKITILTDWQIDHIDGNKHNNKLNNLQWLPGFQNRIKGQTHSDNFDYGKI